MKLWQQKALAAIMSFIAILAFLLSPIMVVSALIALLNAAWMLMWILLGVSVVSAGVFMGAAIHGQDLEEKVRAREKAATETCWDRWDEIITQGGHESVLANLPPSIARQFTPAGQPCPSARDDEEGRHAWKPILTRTRDGHRVGGKWRCACEATTTEQTFAESMAWELKEIRRQRVERETTEITTFGRVEPVRTFGEDDISEILRRRYGISTDREQVRVYHPLADNRTGW